MIAAVAKSQWSSKLCYHPLHHIALTYRVFIMCVYLIFHTLCVSYIFHVQHFLMQYNAEDLK